MRWTRARQASVGRRANVDVRCREYGLASIEVHDNGSGIARANHAMLARKHHTSKLHTLEDLAQVTTFGFRGEALSSLCAVANVTVLTATEADVPMGALLTLDAHGEAIEPETKVARQRGTTVTVTDLLRPLPVRRKELEKHAKREYNKAHALLQAYAIITPGVRWQSVLISADGYVFPLTSKRTTQLAMRSASGPRYIHANITALFGAKSAAHLIPLDLAMDVNAVPMRVTGLISKPVLGAGRSSGDRQYFYVNKRPWDASKVAAVVNHVYKTYNVAQFPCIVADVQVATDQYDVNVSPDKRTILVHEEALLLDAFRVRRRANAGRARYVSRALPQCARGAWADHGRASTEEDPYTRVSREGRARECRRTRQRRGQRREGGGERRPS